jgi:Glycosyltransferase family 92
MSSSYKNPGYAPDVTVYICQVYVLRAYQVLLSPPGYSVKSIIDPQACVNMHNHYCWSVTPGYANRPIDAEVDPTVATSRHYKKCHFDPNECAEHFHNITRDDVMLRFRSRLEAAVRRKIEKDFEYLQLDSPN